MCQDVALESTFLVAGVFTLVAAERLFPSMNKNVLFQITSCCEREGTHGAFVRFFSSILCLGFGCERHHSEFSGIPAGIFFLLIGTSNEELQCCLPFIRVLDQLDEENREFPEENNIKKMKVN